MNKTRIVLDDHIRLCMNSFVTKLGRREITKREKKSASVPLASLISQSL